MWEPCTLVYIPILCALGPEKHMPGGPVRQLRTLLSLLSFCVTCALKFHRLSELWVLRAQMRVCEVLDVWSRSSAPRGEAGSCMVPALRSVLHQDWG